MPDSPRFEKRLSIGEASEAAGVPAHVLRQWEARYHALRPKRNSANRRYYTSEDMTIIARIKTLLYEEGMTTEGINKRLAEEARGEFPPRMRHEAIRLLDAMEADIREGLDLLTRNDGAK